MERIRLSRRRILQLTAMTPLAGLASGTANASTYCPPSRPLHDIPEDAMKHLVTEAKKIDGALSEESFRCLANELWFYFQFGAIEGNRPVPDNSETDQTKKDIKLDLLKGTFDARTKGGEKSGKLIVTRMGDWDQLRASSNVCAFQCGQYAAEEALKEGQEKNDPDPQITRGIYQRAFTSTEGYMLLVMDRVRAINPSGNLRSFAGSC